MLAERRVAGSCRSATRGRSASPAARMRGARLLAVRDPVFPADPLSALPSPPLSAAMNDRECIRAGGGLLAGKQRVEGGGARRWGKPERVTRREKRRNGAGGLYQCAIASERFSSRGLEARNKQS